VLVWKSMSWMVWVITSEFCIVTMFLTYTKMFNTKFICMLMDCLHITFYRPSWNGWYSTDILIFTLNCRYIPHVWLWKLSDCCHLVTAQNFRTLHEVTLIVLWSINRIRHMDIKEFCFKLILTRCILIQGYVRCAFKTSWCLSYLFIEIDN